MNDTIHIAAADVEQESRWLRVAGHAFAASLLEALWAELSIVRLERTTSMEGGSDGKQRVTVHRRPEQVESPGPG